MSDDEPTCDVNGDCSGEIMIVPGTEPQKHICEHHFEKHFVSGE